MPHPDMQPCLFDSLPMVPPPRSSFQEYVADQARRENAARRDAATRERLERAGQSATK